MKVLHVALLQKVPSGIFQQMEWEQEAAKALGFSWDVKIYCCSPYNLSEIHVIQTPHWYDFIPLMKWIRLRLSFVQNLKKKSEEYDVILVRYSVHDLFIFSSLRKLRSKVIFIHHTKEVPELMSLKGTISKTRGMLDYLIAPIFLSTMKRLIAVTSEIADYEKTRYNSGVESYIYPNGIYSTQNIVGPVKKGIVEVLFVSSVFFEWHGLDLLLSSVIKSKKEFRLHLVGELSQEQMKIALLDSRVKIHGVLNKKQIDELAMKSWVGLSSFALYRKGLKHACTLKVREYMELGIPVYAGYPDVFPEDFLFYRQGEADIDKIIEFATEMKDVSGSRIRDESQAYISKSNIVEKLYQWLESSEVLK